MAQGNVTDHHAFDLRSEAEERLSHASSSDGGAADLDTQQLLHELRVHQIELEMQNEELRRTQLALEESRDRYADLYDFAPVAYLTLDPQALITAANLTSTELLAVDRQQLLQCRIASFIAPGDRERWGQYFASMMRHQGRQSCDLTMQRADGREFSGRLECLRVAGSGDELELRIALSDITELRQAEAKREQAQTTMVHMGRLVLAGELAAGLAHELNQPLCSIINYSEACLQRLRTAAGGSDDLIHHLQRIAAEGERAGEIIRRLRGFTRKQTVSDPVPTDINQVIDESLELMTANARTNNVRLYRVSAENLPPARVDPVQIQQVLVNLIQNSLLAIADSAQERREVVVEARPGPRGWVTISVRDSGPGLPESVRRHLFHPFVTTRADGMGLGLSICHSIVTAHGGQLWADETDSAEADTTIHFTLPTAAGRFR
ncbi:ATP-binding protein [Aquisalimonas sp.]|uniref:sensor histidine kinase n=1 Tax=Aquisalimonas sp. TaxID=1872621 RepID=UPI0025BFEBE4|nr:ATP-binding protein [Aquisalimonas sp.]